VKWYKCFITGENFPGELVDQDYSVGFYTTRFVQAESEEAAELVGLDLLRTEDRLQLPEGVMPSESARVYFEEIMEVGESDVPEIQAGFVFFEMES
jgi:hypothetical protein